VTPLLPDPVPLDPPPGEPRALADLAGRLGRAGALLGELGEQVSADAASVPSWSGRDAAAATARIVRVRDLVEEAAGALARAGERLALHADLLEDARARLARLRAAQEEDYGAAAARLGGLVDPASASGAGAIEELRSAEDARRRVAGAIRDEVDRDATATAAVLAGCSTVAGSGAGPGDRVQVLRHLEEVLPGWHEDRLARRGQDLAAALLGGDDAAREAAARDLLPWADEPVVAVAVLTGLGADGFRDVLRGLGNGSLSDRSALARVMAAVLGAPVPPGQAAAVARVRDGRLVDPGDHRGLDADLVALGMGVVLAAGHGDHRAGPPAATVREWGRQIVARERAMGSERIVDRVRLGPAYAPPGDPLEQVLVRLAEGEDPAPAAGLLRGEPTWTHLLARPWDDDGAAFAALVERAGEEPGDVAVRSGLRALAMGLGDDGDPAGWTVDRATAAAVAPALAGAVAAHPEALTGPLVRAAAGAGEDRTLLRGLGHLGTDPGAARALDRAVADSVARLDAAAGAGPSDAAVAVAAGHAAVRGYGERLAVALEGFAAQERAEQRAHVGDLFLHVGGRFAGPLAAAAVVRFDLDGTWDDGPGPQVTGEDAVRAAGGAPGAEAAYRRVADVLGAPTAPVSPATDVPGLLVELVPGSRRARDAVERVVDGAREVLEEVGEG
jgi:hypothetical protein